MKKLLLIVLLAGCAKVPSRGTEVKNGTQSVASSRPAELTDKQKIAELRQEANKRGLQWHIFCTGQEDIDPRDAFQGTAWHRGVTDDETTDRWMEDGKTQAEAAYKLFASIQGPPTHPAEKKRETEAGEICTVPELIGR
jgi:hypothetical protein